MVCSVDALAGSCSFGNIKKIYGTFVGLIVVVENRKSLLFSLLPI